MCWRAVQETSHARRMNFLVQRLTSVYQWIGCAMQIATVRTVLTRQTVVRHYRYSENSFETMPKRIGLRCICYYLLM